jgi:glutaredoxin
MNFTIYGKEMCEYCDKAKEICHQYGFTFDYHPVDDRFVGEGNFAALKERATKENLTIKTVPVIWHNNKFIGGYNELMSYIENTREYGQGGF